MCYQKPNPKEEIKRYEEMSEIILIKLAMKGSEIVPHIKSQIDYLHSSQFDLVREQANSVAKKLNNAIWPKYARVIKNE